MRLLLDSHALLWFLANHPKLSSTAKNLIADPNNTLLLSLASVWELGIKVSVGKLSLADPFDVFIQQAIGRTSAVILPIELAHTLTYPTLPLHHRDPFDRLLIAQAITEQVSVVSNDAAFDPYPISRLW
jgi:PIN domain nuclease of toxin-antitoxin system